MLRMIKDGITAQATANQFNNSLNQVKTITDSQWSLETVQFKQPRRNHLCLGDKIRVLHLMEKHENQCVVSRICKIHPKTTHNIMKQRSTILDAEARGSL